mmetsp:Transcript_4366/g.7931  ORF Transcript_4366/g.7931 Transcript_4366/m.7931 type:complete len:95 (-) Transcript_4366:82-366(-)
MKAQAIQMKGCGLGTRHTSLDPQESMQRRAVVTKSHRVKDPVVTLRDRVTLMKAAAAGVPHPLASKGKVVGGALGKAKAQRVCFLSSEHSDGCG